MSTAPLEPANLTALMVSLNTLTEILTTIVTRPPQLGRQLTALLNETVWNVTLTRLGEAAERASSLQRLGH